jgi:hypothetical protein
VPVRSKASRALSMPVAFRAVEGLFGLGESSSRAERSRPRDFFGGAVLPLLVGLEGREASSSFRRASFSAFLRAASAALAAAASLCCC